MTRRFKISQCAKILLAKSFRHSCQIHDRSIKEQLALRGVSRCNFSIDDAIEVLKLLMTRIPHFPLEKARGHATDRLLVAQIERNANR